MNDKIKIITGNIYDIDADAIVNSVYDSCNVGKDISEAAGPRFVNECRELENSSIGEAKITLGYQLPAKYVIHMNTPRYYDQEAEHPISECYKNSLNLAKFYPIKTLAFPDISSEDELPIDVVTRIAYNELKNFFENDDNNIQEIFIVCNNEYTQKYYMEYFHENQVKA